MADFTPIFIFILIFIAAWGITTYNRFVKYRNMLEEGWSIIDVVLKRRANLIPKLVSTVKGYSDYEADVLNKVVEQRQSGQDHATVKAQESAVSQSLGGLLAMAEAYPDLKASGTFIELQKALGEIENDIAEARNTYNERVRRLNTLVDQFPSVFIARVFNFTRQDYFLLELATERDVPKLPWD